MVDRDAAHRALDALLNLLDELEPRRLTDAAQMLWEHRTEVIDLVRITVEHPEAVGKLLDTIPALLGAMASAPAAGGATPDTGSTADDDESVSRG